MMDNIENNRGLLSSSLLAAATGSTVAERSGGDALQAWVKPTSADDPLNRVLSGEISSSSGSLKPDSNTNFQNAAAAQYFFADWKHQRQQKTALDGGSELLWHAGHVSPSSSSGAMSSPVVSSAVDFAGGVTNDTANFQLMGHNAGGDALNLRPTTTAQMHSAFSLYGSTPEQQQSFNNYFLTNSSHANGRHFIEQLQPSVLSNQSQGSNWAAAGIQPPKQQNASFLADYMSSSSTTTLDGMHAAMAHQQQLLEKNRLWNSGNSSLTGSPQHQHRMLNQDYSSLLYQQQQQQQQLYQSGTHHSAVGRHNSASDSVFVNGMGPSGDIIGNHDVFAGAGTSKMFSQDLGYQQPGAAFLQQQQMPYKPIPIAQQQQQQQQQMYDNRRSSWSPVPGVAPVGTVPPSSYVAIQQPQQQQGACGYYCSSTANNRSRGLPASSASSGSGSGSARQQQQSGASSFAIGHWNSSEEAKSLQQSAQAHHHQYQSHQYRQQQQQQQFNIMPQQTSLMTQSAGELNGGAGAPKSVGGGKDSEFFDFNGKFGMFVADSTMYRGNGKQQQHQGSGSESRQHVDMNSTASKPLASTGINNFFNQLTNEDQSNHTAAASTNQQALKPKRVIPGLTTTAAAAAAPSTSKKASRASRQRSANAASSGGHSATDAHQAPPPAPVVDMDAVAAAVVQLSNTPFSYAAVARKKTIATNSGGSSTVGGAIGSGGGGGTPRPQATPGEADGVLLRSRTASVDTGLHTVNGGRSHSAAPASPVTAVRGSAAAEAGWHEVGSKQLNKTGVAVIAKKASNGMLIGKKSLNKNKIAVAGNKRSGVSKAGDVTDGSVGTVNKFANISMSDDEDEGEDDDDDDDYAGGRHTSDSTESPDELTLNNMKQIDMNSLHKVRTTLQLTNNDLSMDAGPSSSAGKLMLMDKLNNQLKAADASGYYAMTAALAGKKVSNKNTNIQQHLLAEGKLAGSLSSADENLSASASAVEKEETTADTDAGYQFSVASILYTILYFAFLFVKIPLVKTCIFIIFMVRSVLDSLWHVWLELYQSTLFATKHSTKSFKNLQAPMRRNWLKFKRAFANGGREQHRESSHYHHYHGSSNHHHPGGNSGNSDSRFISALTTGDQVMRRLYYVDSVLGWNPYDILGVSDSDKREVVEEQMTKTVDLVLQDVALRYGVAEAIKLLTWAVKSIVDEAKKKEIDKALKSNSCIMPSIVGDAECFLQRMREKYDTKTEYQLPCYRCGKKHMRHKVENRDLLNGRYCKTCGCHHQVKEGDIWCETSFLGLVTRYFACVDGLIYEITAFAMCQKSDLPELKPSTHQIYYRIPSPDVYVEDMWLNDLKSCRKPRILGSVAPRTEAMPCGRAARRRKVRAK